MHVDLHNVHQLEQRCELTFQAAEVVQGQREASLLQFPAALNDAVVDPHRLEYFEHHFIWRQKLDDFVHEQRSAQVDEAGMFSEHLLYAKFRERMIDDGRAGEQVILDFGAVQMPGSEQEFESSQILTAIEDGLTPQKQIWRRSIAHVSGER